MLASVSFQQSLVRSFTIWRGTVIQDLKLKYYTNFKRTVSEATVIGISLAHQPTGFLSGPQGRL